jgi:hypothetical protein
MRQRARPHFMLTVLSNGRIEMSSAVMQHVVFAPFWLEATGQVRLGLRPQNPVFC